MVGHYTEHQESEPTIGFWKFICIHYMHGEQHDNDFSNAESDVDDEHLASKGGGADEVLYTMLKDLTKKIAKQNNLQEHLNQT